MTVRYLVSTIAGCVVACVSLLMGCQAAAAQDCTDKDFRVATDPVPPVSDKGKTTYSRQAAATPPNVDLMLLGDSLTELWPLESWRPLRVASLGVSGDRTATVLWRLASHDWSAWQAKNILLVLGTNNLSNGEKPCGIVHGMTRVIERTAAVWPAAHIFVLEIMPRGEAFRYRDADRQAINAALRQIKGIKTINVDQAISCQMTQPCGNYTDDKLHLTGEGYTVLVEQVKRAMQEP